MTATKTPNCPERRLDQPGGPSETRQYGPNAVPEKRTASAAALPAQILVAGPVDAGNHPRAGTGPRQVHPGRHHRHSAGLERRPQLRSRESGQQCPSLSGNA